MNAGLTLFKNQLLMSALLLGISAMCFVVALILSNRNESEKLEDESLKNTLWYFPIFSIPYYFAKRINQEWPRLSSFTWLIFSAVGTAIAGLIVLAH